MCLRGAFVHFLRGCHGINKSKARLNGELWWFEVTPTRVYETIFQELVSFTPFNLQLLKRFNCVTVL